MKTEPEEVCNYAILRFRPYPETEEFVNVGVLVSCQQPCLFHFLMERTMPTRARALFPHQNEEAFAAAAGAMGREMDRMEHSVRDSKGARLAFAEAIRKRESVFRFSDPKTILTNDARKVAEELFRHYVRMEAAGSRPQASEATAIL